MTQIHPAWLEHQRRTWLRHDWQKWLRPDWQRWQPPDPGPSMRERLWRPYRAEPPPQRRVPELTEVDIATFRTNLAALRFKLALLKWRVKAGFNPDQPRVPAGNPEGGKWTSGGGATGGNLGRNDSQIISDATPDNLWKPGAQYAQNILPSATGPATGESVLNMPPGADIEQNMREAEAHRGDYLWFYNQVHNKGPWDYKQIDKQYEDFGNFNYGATGRAAGFSEETLLRAAGWAQVGGWQLPTGVGYVGELARSAAWDRRQSALW